MRPVGTSYLYSPYCREEKFSETKGPGQGLTVPLGRALYCPILVSDKGGKGFCFGSTRCLRAKARKADRAAKRSAAVSKAALALQDCSDVAHGGFGALGGGWGSPHLLCFNLTRPDPGNRVTNNPRRAGTNPRRIRGALFVLFRGLPTVGVDGRAFCTTPQKKAALALAASALL